ncbi:MAG: hypothetical protein HOE45_06730 [Gammaproteobacteria bacterium]|nr:hypothetical protein [Gammaproteobacteria bacterium]
MVELAVSLNYCKSMSLTKLPVLSCLPPSFPLAQKRKRDQPNRVLAQLATGLSAPEPAYFQQDQGCCLLALMPIN